uniref:NADH-ubiquinone oxidoreductase chain 6 n=1 Tax=Cerambycidae sp. 9 KM-2017 TaxID=2219294 RepID=A0A346RJC1_9CUCU|nr:NADH dehydrogenase subunit 6 [Cerambycidae sp. 9 KM-2017]
MILSFLLIVNSLIFITLNHPLSLGLMLLIQTILTSLLIGFMNLNYWFSYILFLVMIGGMLILFIYMTSIASNEKFKFSSKISASSLMAPLFIFILLMIDHFFLNQKINSLECLSFDSNKNFIFIMNKIFNYPIFNNYSMIIIYLLISLIMVVKITDSHYGPLRQMK